MKFKKIMFVGILLLAIFAIGAVSASDVNDTLVASEATAELDNEKTESDIISSSNDDILNAQDNGTFTALQNKINNTEEGLTITLENDYYYDDGFSNGGISISKPLTIDGKGRTIDGNYLSRAFTVSSSNVFLKNITFKNCFAGFTAMTGGAVFLNSGNVNIENARFINCSSIGSAGAAYGGSCINCTFTNCSSALHGGALCYSSATNCSFTNCYTTQSDGSGGAIYSHGMNITDCSFTNCSANIGGAIYLEGRSFQKVDNCTFVDCSSINVVYFDQNYASVNNCTFKNCSNCIFFYRSHSNVTNTVFISCDKRSIKFDSDNNNLIGCNFTMCSGAFQDGIVCCIGNTNILNCNFKNCSATRKTDISGGIIGGENGFVKNCSFIKCISTSGESIYGGVIYSSFNIQCCEFKDCLSVSDSIYGGTIYGGELLNCTFKNCTSKGDYIKGKVISNCKSVNCTFSYYPEFNIVASTIMEGEILEITITTDKDVYGELRIHIDNKTYNTTFKNGKVNFTIGNLKKGEYPAIVNYTGNGSYMAFEKSFKVTVKGAPDIEIMVNDINQGETAVIVISARTAGYLNISVDNEKYNMTFANQGNYTINITDLDVGSHSVMAVFKNSENNITEVSKTFNVKIVKVDPAMNIVIADFNEGSNGLIIIKTDDEYNGKVTVKILNTAQTYDINVKNGYGEFIINSLGAGSYTAQATSSENEKFIESTKTVSFKVNAINNSRVIASDANVIYSSGSYYTISVYGPDGKLANGVTVKITGKISKTLTTKNGIAKFKVTQVPGTYKITITALGKSVTKTITVKHIITLKTATLKKSAKKLTLQATLAKVNGKYLKKKTITFKINGKKYTAKTNKKGVAKITIKNPSVVKKLKVGKKVTYQATYLKDTVKKTAKIKK